MVSNSYKHLFYLCLDAGPLLQLCCCWWCWCWCLLLRLENLALSVQKRSFYLDIRWRIISRNSDSCSGGTRKKPLSRFIIWMFFTFLKAADVPSWMFIGWINQMVAILDKREGKAVHAILQEIARTYPQVNKVLV